MNSSPASRLERRKAATRTAILEAASALFNASGSDSTSIQQIAARADAGVGTLYGYFASKDDVLRAVIVEGGEAAAHRYRATVHENMPLAERFILALDLFAGYIAENRELLRAAMRLRAGPETNGRDTPGAWVYEAFRSLIQAGIDRGEFRAVPVEAAARTIIMTYATSLLGIGLWQGGETDPHLTEDLRELVRAMLFAPARSS